MPTTVNNTLPNEWRDDVTYYEGDTVIYLNIIYRCSQTSLNNTPPLSPENWKPIDIYMKDATVMEHGDYSGDQNMWERDQIYIDGAGWVYINNENTGINVRGPQGGTTVNFEDLTPAQKEQIRGPQGIQGPQGEKGPQGERGPAGEVTLTPSQIETLRGPEGKSAYDIWLEQGYTGSEADFINWLRSGVITLDDSLSATSVNGVENRVITNAFQTYRNNLTETINLLSARVLELENKLKAVYNDTTHWFQFGITSDGRYGYRKNNRVIPFDYTNGEPLSSAGAETETGAFLGTLGEYGSPPVLNGLNANSALTSTNAVTMSFQDAFGLYNYIYKNGRFYNEDYDMKLNGMSFDYVSLTTETDLYSRGLTPGEGILFSPAGLSYSATKIYIEVEPLNDGDTIYYQIGKFNNYLADLPDIITDGTYRVDFEDGAITTRTVIEYTYNLGQGVYFGTTQIGQFNIVSIYVE
jgi:hypothetical protein